MSRDRKPKKKISEDNKDFFRLGVLEGEKNLRVVKELNTILEATNATLGRLVRELDERDPIVGVTLSFKRTKQAIKAIRKGCKRCGTVGNLRLAQKVEEALDEAVKIADAKVLCALMRLNEG